MMTTNEVMRSVSRERLVEITRTLVGVASPTGGERALAEEISKLFTEASIDATLQALDRTSANVWGTVGSGDGPTLLLYAPMDTVTTGTVEDDVPWAAPVLRPDMLAQAGEEHGWITGLGAHNPKGHGACVIAALEAFSLAGCPVPGRLVAGFGALGMPENRRAAEMLDGHGAGCLALVDEVRPDAAVIAKSGWAVSWSEVGLLWFTVEVDGLHTYVGSRHLLPYRNAIAAASRIVLALEDWFETWASTHGDELHSPQGIVGSIAGGVARATAFTPSSCSFTVDLRVCPGADLDAAEHELAERVHDAVESSGASARVVRTVTVPGSFTDPESPIVRAAIDAWEASTGRAHEPIRGLSGATDANILRSAGVPTARVGLPKVAAPGVDVDFAYGMNAVDPDDQVALTRQLIATVANFYGGST